MAVFLMAKFLSEALVWKYKHPNEKYYPPNSNIKYEPFIYEKARQIFSDYSAIYPKNEDFTAKIVHDLQARNIRLIKTINPEIITSEMKAANKQFGTEKQRLEQQQIIGVKTVNTVPRLSPKSVIRRTILPIQSAKPPIENKSVTDVSLEKTSVSQVRPRFRFQLPKLPTSSRNAALGAGSALSRVFQGYIGKNLTFDRMVPAVFGVLGGIGGGIASQGDPLAIAAGAGGGAIGSSYLTSPEGRNLLGRVGKGTIDAGVNTSNRVGRGNLLKTPSRRVSIAILLSFALLVVFGGALGSFGGPVTLPGEAAPIPGNVGIGNTAPTANITTPNIVSPISSLGCSTSMSALEINNYFDKNGYYNFAGTGQAFAALAQTYQINPALIIAIGIQESSLGNVYKGKISESTKNAFGLMQNDALMKFNSWEEGVGMAFKTIASYKCSTIECMGQKYAPIGVKNDPNNYNKDWVAGVAKGFNIIPQSSCTPTSTAQIGPDRPSGWPTAGIITEGPFESFSHQQPPQNAVDLANDARTPVYSTLNGTVSQVVYDDPKEGYGVRVVVTNKQTGAEVLFGHLIPQSNNQLKLNQQVSKGDLIGLMDSTGRSTGSHLHYEIRGSLSKEQFGQFIPGGIYANKSVIKQVGNPGEWTSH